MSKNWTAADIPSQAGRRAVVTGANSGIGFFTALELARHGAEVVLPARSLAKAEEAAGRIRAQVPGAHIVPALLDLASFAGIRSFAAFYAGHFSGASLDLLINNAGVMALPRREVTQDGYERQFATNYLGPFLLTALLFGHLKPQRGTRIVTVASSAANFGKINFDDLQSARAYSPMWGAYSQSKLADLIFAQELQRRLTAAGSPVLSTAAHPGYAITNLQAHAKADRSMMGHLMNALSMALTPLLSQDAAHGALPTLLAATAPDVALGSYYGPAGFQELKGPPAPARITAPAQDTSLAKKLWDETEKLTGVAFAPS